MLATAAIAAAQGSVFHLYVDPIYGDDSEAWNYKPGDPAPGPQAGVPGQTHPGAAPVITGHLHHAPYSFHTVGKAIEWVTNRLPVVQSTRDAHLPYQNPTTHVVFDEIVIHRLPGLYGPRRDPRDDRLYPQLVDRQPRAGSDRTARRAGN